MNQEMDFAQTLKLPEPWTCTSQNPELKHKLQLFISHSVHCTLLQQDWQTKAVTKQRKQVWWGNPVNLASTPAMPQINIAKGR